MRLTREGEEVIHCSLEKPIRPFGKRKEVVVEENPLLPLPKGMQIDQIHVSENEVSITVIATHPCVGYLGHLFIKSGSCAETISRLPHRLHQEMHRPAI
jgi:hypothetical protein